MIAAQQKGPAAGNGTGGKKIVTYEYTPSQTWGPTLDFAAVHNAKITLDVEERFLSCLWWAPIETCDAAAAAGLTLDEFSDPIHRDVAAVLRDRAELYATTGTLAEMESVRYVLNRTGTVFADAGVPTDLEQIIYSNVSGVGAENYARIIRHAARRRKRISKALAHIGRLCSGEWWREAIGKSATITVRPRRLRGRVVA